ncbi:methyltransferase domain-containing protein [Pseudomonas sp. CCC3.2]|uniref:methyltransferase domain-containing protein n=1 Tax=unclassified Pseudomonas TaxID=196821 RepID=UPI002AB5DA84|nr:MULTISPECIES: methyltransferase domain-containing protein [unclassified Pseudomonas]MDY7559101.1 methyltransferase domain-containing protein [Pseudomonas sp. AB6]MEB0179891.1 methyltransferase domain-containing protein [Pseudomonas sp. CCC3.2]MEB0209169.1 methyltransferase domain-containing protein [Pseudomonas sp. AB6]
MSKTAPSDEKKEKSEHLRLQADIALTENNFADAHKRYKQSLLLDPTNDRALNNLAILHEEQGEIKLALSFYKKACAASKTTETQLKYYQNLASAYEYSNQHSAAVWTYQAAIKLESNSTGELSKNYLRLLQSLHIESFDRVIFDSLAPLIDNTLLDKQAAANIYFEQLGHLVTLSRAGETKNILNTSDLLEDNANTLKLISTQLVNSPIIEMEIRRARRKIARQLIQDCYNGKHLPFLAAMSAQCRLNGYIYKIETEDQEIIESLKLYQSDDSISTCRCKAIERVLASYSRYSPNESFPVGAYQAHPVNANNLHIGSPEIFVMASCRKREITADFYEAYPYPAWSSVPYYRETTLNEALSQLNVNRTSLKNNGEFILVAGCGTGRHAIQLALTYPETNIIGLDISMASLQYALTKSRELNVANITFVQGSIYDVDELKIKFRLIECIGVLHHLKYPVKGCRALLSSLKPGGVLKLGLYSTLARQPLKKLAQQFSESEISFSPKNLPRIRDFILLNSSAEAFNEIIKSPDFYNRSGCMDLFFNPLKHTYTVQKISELLHLTKATFAGFERAGERNSPGFRQFYDSTSLEDFFENWDIFEKSNPSFFGAMYLFWLKPNHT